MTFIVMIINFLLDNALHFLSLFKRLDKKRVIFNSTGNINYNFNSKFLFEYLLQIDEPEVECFFVVNDDGLRTKLLDSGLKNIISSKRLKYKFLIFNAKVWVCSTIESPVECIFKRRDRIVYHLGHGVPLKNIGLAENKISVIKKINRYLKLRIFTHVTCYSDYFEDVLYRAFNCNDGIEYLKLGQPRNDTILSEDLRDFQLMKSLCLKFMSDIQFRKAKKILYCPTWRNFAVTEFFPFTDFDLKKLNDVLEENNIIIFTREHPYYKSQSPVGINNIQRVVPLNADVVNDITPCLSFFDKLLTDYSSIFVDFLITGKSVGFIPYDLTEYNNVVGFSKPYDQLTVGEKIICFEGFLNSIRDNTFNGYTSDYLNKFNVKSSGNCLEHYLNIVKLANSE